MPRPSETAADHTDGSRGPQVDRSQEILNALLASRDARNWKQPRTPR